MTVPLSNGLHVERNWLAPTLESNLLQAQMFTSENIQELVYVESHLSNTNTQYYGELTQAMLALAEAPGSNNGTGFMQTLAAFAIRELYNKKAASDKLQENVKKAAAA